TIRARILTVVVGLTLLLTLGVLVAVPMIVGTFGLETLAGGTEVQERLIVELLLALFLGAAGGLALAIVGATFLALSIVRPIGRLAEFSGAVAAGKLERVVPAEGPAEVVALAEALNEMARALQRSFAAIEAERDHTTAILDQMTDAVLI